MKRRLYTMGAVMAALIAIGCGGGTDTGTDSGSTSTDTSATAPKKVSDFSVMGKGGRKFDNGITVEVGKPKKITPGEYTIGHTKGNTAVEFPVTVINGSSEPYDVTWLTVSADMGKAGVQAEQLYGDGYGGAEGKIQVGKRKTIKFAFSAPTKDTSELNVVVEPGLMDGVTALFQGKL